MGFKPRGVVDFILARTVTMCLIADAFRWLLIVRILGWFAGDESCTDRVNEGRF